MRISGGTVKGRKVAFKAAPESMRPTSSKVREAIFDIIRDRIKGASFLDLYAGTGGVGIEALSRGAGEVAFVESNGLRVKMINHLITEFGFRERSRVIKGEAYDFIKRESERRHKYDIIFLDPPYHSEELMKVLPLIGGGGVLEDRGIVIAEHSSKTALPDVIGRLNLIRDYRYGDTTLTLYRKEAI